MVSANHVATLRNIIKHFPPVKYSISYGSGSIPQKGYDYSDPAKGPMIDFIFAVDDPVKWHEQNMAVHRSHYSILALGGPSFVANIQDNYGARIYYNTLVQIDKHKIKYGVISYDSLQKDLMDWETFYVSGRMQKPVLNLQDDAKISECNKVNLKNAIAASLLLLPETFDETALYEKIASLSYLGDVRMKLAENPRKVHNMVARNMDAFHNLYWDTITENNNNIFSNIPQNESDKFQVKKTPENKLWCLEQIPKPMQDYFVKQMGFPENQPRKQVLEEIINKNKEGQAVEIGVANVVSKYSQQQTLKGIFTAGVVKSFQYAAQKVKSSKK